MMDEEIVEAVRAAVYEVLDRMIQPGTTKFDDMVRDTTLAAIEAHTAALDAAGFVIVPREPTKDMKMAGDDLMPYAPGTETHRIAGGKYPEDYWHAMIAAAPDQR